MTGFIIHLQVQRKMLRREFNAMSIYHNFGNITLSTYDLSRHNFLTRVIEPRKISSSVVGIKSTQRTIVCCVSGVLLL